MSRSGLASVAIVGAGPAGLAVGALLARAGISPLLLESGESVGWSWHCHEPWLVLHTTRTASGLPLVPFESGSRYPHRDEVAAYLGRYATLFDLDVRLRTEVLAATRESDSWHLDTRTGGISARSVVIATGAFRRPRRPTIEGSERFAGPILHSRELRKLDELVGKRVVVVGAGNTGCDLAAELARVGASPALSKRGPIFALPRDVCGANWRTLLDLAPYRAGAVARRVGARSQRAAERLAAGLWSGLAKRRFAGTERAGLGLMRAPELQEHFRSNRPPVTSERALDAVARGEISVVPEVASLDGETVRFTDGRSLRADALVLATGFKPGLEDLLGDSPSAASPQRESEEALGLYRCGFEPALREIGRSAREIASRILSRADLLP